jgi:integrase
VHGLISAALDRCVPERIPVNPCKRVDLPTSDEAGDLIRFLTFAEFERIKEALPDRYKPFVLFLVVTGARLGEATAVTVRDVLFDAFTSEHGTKVSAVRINKAWKRLENSQWVVKMPKNPWSKRTVSISKPLADELRKLCEGRGPDEYLFVNEHGGHVRESVFYEMYKGRLGKIREVDPSFTADPTIHDLRHTSASWLIQGGWDLFKIARRLGHRDTSMIDRVYGHLMPEGMIEGARRIEDAMRPKELEQPDPVMDEADADPS